MSSHIHKESGQSETARKPAPRPGYFAGLVESIRHRKDRVETIDLIRISAESGDTEALGEAVGKFASLDGKSKEKVLRQVQDRICRVSGFPFESESSVREITALSRFIADSRPGADSSMAKAAGVLMGVIGDSSFFDARRKEHLEAKYEIARALWALRAGSRDFWEERIFDQATSDFTIRSLLSHEPSEGFEESGWALLRKNLPRIALAVAFSESDRKADFFASMMLDKDPQVIKAALAGALYLPAVPPELLDIARDISKMGDGLGFASFAFTEGARLKGMLEYADGRQFEGARGLLTLYCDGAAFLAPMLAHVAQEMAEILAEPPGATEEEKGKSLRSAFEVLVSMSEMRIPGVRIDIQREG